MATIDTIKGSDTLRTMYPKVNNGLAAVNDQVTAVDGREASHYNDLSGRVNNIVANSGSGNTEIVDAREGQATLKARIDAVEQQAKPGAVPTHDFMSWSWLGARYYAPECTLAAIQFAAKQGFYGVRLPFRLSSDGYWVCIYDATTTRTTNSSYTVNTTPLATLKGLDAGSWFTAKFAGERIPTLDEVLDLCKINGLALAINILEAGTISDANIQKILDSVNKKRMMGMCVVSNSDLPTIQSFRRLNNRIPLEMYQSSPTTTNCANLQAVGRASMYCPIGNLNATNMATAQSYDIRIDAGIIDTNTDLMNAVSLGAAAIISNKIVLGKE